MTAQCTHHPTHLYYMEEYTGYKIVATIGSVHLHGVLFMSGPLFSMFLCVSV